MGATNAVPKLTAATLNQDQRQALEQYASAKSLQKAALHGPWPPPHDVADAVVMNVGRDLAAAEKALAAAGVPAAQALSLWDDVKAEKARARATGDLPGTTNAAAQEKFSEAVGRKPGLFLRMLEHWGKVGGMNHKI